MLNVNLEDDGIHYVDDHGNEVMVARPVYVGTADCGEHWECVPDVASFLPEQVLYSRRACEWYALTIHQTLIDTGH